MSDRRADGARRKAGGLILLSVAWVAVLGLVPQSSNNDDQTGGGGGSSNTNDIKIEYTCLKDGFGTYDALSQTGVRARVKSAFGDAGQNVYYRTSDPLDTTNAIWNYDHIHILYSHYKKDPDYRYWLVSVKGLVYQGVLSDKLGYTPVTNSPGHDCIPSEPHSIVMYENIDRTAATNDDWQWWPTTVIHEMGHQRAALTHPEDWFGDHWPDTYPTGYNCVMHLMKRDTGEELPAEQVKAILDACKFCGYPSDYNNGEKSCVRFNYQRGLPQ
jgi:hypothetical protein